ncbi:hypothetical protein [Roseiconus lacunae]|uniref:hypothetical protein n=1 Tax=Roseiconus lacunae TaxID=2605694 RepID=UPI001E480E50|nr:hypothetical protein [Roseiconus lacunae]MCD0459103.1 hypothetical protein [Roseiconus lacunae]
MSTGTTLVYNGVILRECETQAFDQIVEYDESKTDVLFSRFRIRVISTIVGYTSNLQPERGIQVGASVGSIRGSIADQIRAVHQRLSTARKDFYFFIDDAPSPRSVAPTNASELSSDILLVAAGFDQSKPPNQQRFQMHPTIANPATETDAFRFMDPDNGPKPIDVSVEQIFGGRTMRVSFEIEVCRVMCDGQGSGSIPAGYTAGELIGRPRQILSNRWSLSETRDENWALTRTLEGTLRVASKAIKPHLMRYFVLPTLPRGFQRVSQTFATDPTDVVLKYSIQDRQADDAPPPPAIKWQGHYAEIGTGAGASKQLSELTVRLEGPPKVNKQDLIAAAGRVVNARIKGLRSQLVPKDPQDPESGLKLVPSKVIILDTAVVEILGQPAIEMRIRVNSTAADTELFDRMKTMGAPIDIAGYHPDVWPTPAPFQANSIAGLFECYLQDPCSIWHSVPRPAFNKPYPSAGGSLPPIDKGCDENADGYCNGTDATLRQQRINQSPAPVLYQGTEPFENYETNLSEEQLETEKPYTHYNIVCSYDIDHGLIQLPYARESSEEKSCFITRLHGGMAKRTVDIEATRRDEVPVLPKPQDELYHPPSGSGITERLQSSELDFLNPEFTGNGVSRLHRVAAKYTYLLDRVPSYDEQFRLVITPFDASGEETRAIDGTKLFDDQVGEWKQPTESPGEEQTP